VTETAGRRLLAAVSPAAAGAGLAPGMPLADALSFLPGLATRPADPAADAAGLTRLAEWCGRYSPWTAPDGADGIKVEITGSAHLWGGEAALAADVMARLSRQGIAARLAVADTIGAAWAVARFAGQPATSALVASGDMRAALAPLPVEALRLDPVAVQGLRRVGLRRIGELYPMPRDPLARRFGEIVVRRLDQALDALPEPLSPLGETPSRRIRLSFPEAIADPSDLAHAIERLTQELARCLAREGVGVRRLGLAFHRIDGRVEHIRIGTARPSRDPSHLASLLRARLDTVDPGLGVEDMILAAFAVEPLPAEQIALSGQAGAEASGLAPFIDRLGARLGLAALTRLEPRDSHLPERAAARVPVGAPAENGAGREMPRFFPLLDPPAESKKPPRPVRLFEPPEPVEAFWLVPDDPPFHFTWRRRRHLIAQADGPERIAEEWWAEGGSGKADAIRDYYRVEDAEGRRFWLFRAGLADGSGAGLAEGGRPPRWFLHGIFA